MLLLRITNVILILSCFIRKEFRKSTKANRRTAAIVESDHSIRLDYSIMPVDIFMIFFQSIFDALLLFGKELGNQFIVPFVGTGNLLGGLELAESTLLVVGQVTLGPLAETGGDLLDATDWVGFVVAAEW